MMTITFNIQNPFRTQYKDLYNTEKNITKNKIFSVKIYRGADIINFDFSAVYKHSTIDMFLTLGIFGYTLHSFFYDKREWNFKENRWFNGSDYEEE